MVSRRSRGGISSACALTAVFGHVLGENVSAATGAAAAAVAAGGVLSMLTVSSMPFALEKGGDQTGIWTVVGFAVTLAMV